jgi:hypothetical protein
MVLVLAIDLIEGVDELLAVFTVRAKGRGATMVRSREVNQAASFALALRMGALKVNPEGKVGLHIIAGRVRDQDGLDFEAASRVEETRQLSTIFTGNCHLRVTQPPG